MLNFYLILPFLVLTFSIWLFNGCSGAAAKRAEILNSINSTLEEETPELPPSELSDEEVDKKLEEETVKEEKAEDDPTKFNYFPYDLQLDTISYMSCENNNYFTFKAGAYFARSGLRLSEYFLRKKDSLSPDALETLIKSSIKHIAIPRLLISHKNNLLFVLQNSKTAFPLRLHRLIKDLIVTGNTRIRNLNGEFTEAKITNGSSAFFYVRGLSQGYRLVLSYLGGNKNKMLHTAKGEAGVDIYGRVYSLQFDEVLDGRNIITSISEKKLPQSPPQPSWSCPESLNFEIRRHPLNAYKAQEWYDAQTNVAYKKKYPNLQSALDSDDPTHRPPANESLCSASNSGGSVFAVASTVLGSEWNINVNDGCISPKSASVTCYKITDRNNVYERLAIGDSNCSSLDRKKYCPQLLSICVRKN